jgi:hypothetical protein
VIQPGLVEAYSEVDTAFVACTSTGGRDTAQGLDKDVIEDVTISTVLVVIGTGRRLLGGRPQTKTWTLASARSFPSGLVQAHYDRKR